MGLNDSQLMKFRKIANKQWQSRVRRGFTASIERDALDNQASKIIQDIIFLAKVGRGNSGDLINITYVDSGLISQVLSINVVGDSITVNLATSLLGALTSTATLIKAAIDIHPQASLLVDLIISGVGANIQAAELQTFLVGGLDAAAYRLLINPGAVVQVHKNLRASKNAFRKFLHDKPVNSVI